MSLTIVCLNCSVRLTLGDDRIGTTFPCPKCDTNISVRPVSASGADSKPDLLTPSESEQPAQPGASTPSKIQFTCPTCRKVYKAKFEDSGKKMVCKECGAVSTIPGEPLPPPTSKRPPSPPIEFLCPACRTLMAMPRRSAGTEMRCPGCDRRVIVPTPTDEPLEGIPVEPKAPVPKPLPPPDSPPPSFNSDREGDDDELDDYELPYLRHRRRQQRLTIIWRAVTLSAIGISFVCYFLPWVRYAVVIPLNPYIHQDRVEFASQSGLEMTFAHASLHPALERWIKLEEQKIEVELRRKGKNPFDEWLKENKPYMAPWLLLYPFALFISFLLGMTSRPTFGPCMLIGGLTIANLLLLFIQFGIFHPPAVDAFYDHVVKNYGAGGALLVSFLLDVQYTGWFALAVFGIVVATLTQWIVVGLEYSRRWTS